jgi:hypothetical protein
MYTRRLYHAWYSQFLIVNIIKFDIKQTEKEYITLTLF